MNEMLHADHVDATGAYAQKFELVKELVSSGALKEIPQEFRVKTDKSVLSMGQTVVEPTKVVQTVQQPENPKFSMNREHADHIDQTGEYMRAWEEKYGSLAGEPTPEQQQQMGQSSWKGFLQQIIAEEKSKLNI